MRETQPLTSDDIAALRHAESVTFHYSDGQGYIVALLNDIDRDRLFTKREQIMFPNASDHDRARRIITDTGMFGCGQPDISGWNITRNEHARRTASAFHMVHAAQHHAPWITMARFLRPGDIITLIWVADNNTDNIREVGLHADDLILRVTRVKGDNETTHEFLVTRSVGPNNSTRMIRYYGE